MARVLVVSRNAAMAMGLSATEHQVLDLRPAAFGDWIDSADDADALVLDLENPDLAAAAVRNLRAHGKTAPTLLVSSTRPGWDTLDRSDLSGTDVLPLPITRPALLSALEELLASPRSVTGPTDEPFFPAEPPAAAPRPTVDTAAVLDELVAEEVPDESLDDELDRLISSVATPAAVDLPLAADRPLETVPVDVRPPAGPVTPAGSPAEESTLTAVPRTRRSTVIPVTSGTRVLDDLDRLRHAPAAAPTPPAPSPPKRRQRRESAETALTPAPTAAPASRTSGEPIDLVRALATVTHRLYGVPETAEVIIGDAVERTLAEAGALMVPDEGTWRVSGGVGLRPIEHRYELYESSWLVSEIARGHKGAIVEESDIARDRLQGAPLASWRHLLTAPVPEVEALIILARREDPPFTEDDLAILAAIGEEAGELLQAALDTRALARAMWQYRDENDLPR